MSTKFLAVAAACFFVSGISAQENTDRSLDTTIELKEFILFENRLSLPASEVNRNMEIVRKSDMKKLPSISLPELFSHQAGVDVRQRGPAGVQADLSINGGTFEQTLILLNGIKMSDPQTGHHAMNVPLMFDNLDRIEILKGPAARKYGQNAYAGAVNFITKVPDSNRIHFRGYGGDFNSFGGNVSISNRTEKVGNYLSYGTDISDGYRYNTDYTIQNVFYQAEVALSKNSQLDVVAGYTDRTFGANGFYASPEAEDQFEEVKTAIGSVTYSQQIDNWKISPRISWRRNSDNYQYNRKKPKSYQNFHETDAYSFELNANGTNPLGQSGYGVEYRKETISGTWLRGGALSESNLNGFNRENFGAYAEQLIRWNKFTFSPGWYFGWNSEMGAQFFPGASAGYYITSNLRAQANISKSFRVPTFYDQHYTSPNEQGNPDLKPEKAWTYEAGLTYHLGRLMIKGNGFFRDNQNLIDWVLRDGTWHAQNYGRVETKGLEVVMQYSEKIGLLGYFGIRDARISYNKLYQDQLAQEMISRYALEHLSDQMIASVQLDLVRNWNLNVHFRNLKRIGQDSYTLLDLKLSWERGMITAFAEITNATNESYSEVMTRMPGRWAKLGVQLNLPY